MPSSEYALRFEEGIDEDVVAVQLKAVFVVDDDSLAALQAVDKDLVDLLEQLLHLPTQVKAAMYPWWTHDHARHFLNWCDICEVAKVVQGNRSDNYNRSDTWLSVLLLELY